LVLAALAVATVAQGSSDFQLPEIYQDYNGELLEMPLTPPKAGEADFSEDIKGDEMLADQEKEDSVMNFMQAIMEDASQTEDTKAAIKDMDSDIQRQKIYLHNVDEEISDRKKSDDENNKKKDKFAALRAKFPTFASDSSLVTDAPDCTACIAAFEKNGGCDAWKTANTASAVSDLVPKGCTQCAHAAEVHCGVSEAHQAKEEHHLAPTHYSVVPVGTEARKADADLAAGADADRKEDWKVHQATYHALHPSARRLRKEKAKAAEKMPPKVAPLKQAQHSFHHALDTIDATKQIATTPLVKLTLDDAKKSCASIRTMAKKKCDADAHNTHFFCITEGTTEKQCDTEKMKDAAECDVAHQTAYNKCFSLWKRAKKNIHNARERAAAPMTHTDEEVKDMSAGTTKCAGLMKDANTSCKAAFDKYHDDCKKKVLKAIEVDFMEEMAAPKAKVAKAAKKADAATKELKAVTKDAAKDDTKKKSEGAKIAKKASEDSKAALKDAEHLLKKETSSDATKDAIVKCELKKNIAKRTCIKAVHSARDSCDKMTSTDRDDRDQGF